MYGLSQGSSLPNPGAVLSTSPLVVQGMPSDLVPYKDVPTGYSVMAGSVVGVPSDGMNCATQAPQCDSQNCTNAGTFRSPSTGNYYCVQLTYPKGAPVPSAPITVAGVPLEYLVIGGVAVALVLLVS